MAAMPVDEVQFPDHPEAWTIAELLALPEDQGSRVELVDGMVVVSPAPTSRHQRVLQRLQAAFLASTPPDFESLPGVNVVLSDTRLLIPDLVVLTTPGRDTVYYQASEVALAVEVHSPSTKAFDRVFKRKMFAESGIPFLLLADPMTEPATAVCLELVDGQYEEIARSDGGQLRLTRPFPVTVELTSLGG